MGSFSLTHWLIVLVVVVLVFGTSRLKNAGKDLGGAVKGFKEAVRDENKEQNQVKNQASERNQASSESDQT